MAVSRVRAVVRWMCGGAFPALAAGAATVALLAPSPGRAAVNLVGETRATFRWGPPSTGTAVSYTVYVRRNGGSWIEAPSLATRGRQATVSGRFGDVVSIAVRAVDRRGAEGPFSLPSPDVRFVRGTAGGGASPAPGGARSPAPYDLDGDGCSEVVWSSAVVGAALATGGCGADVLGIVGLRTGYPGVGWRIEASGDFDGDGRADLLLHRPANGKNVLWMMDGDEPSDVVVLPPMGPSCTAAAADDFDADGRDDLLWRCDSGHNSLWLMDGAGIRLDANLPWEDPSWTARAAGDFDGDGHADVLWQNDLGLTRLWLMDGAQVADALPLALRDPSWLPAVGDFDGDGKADVFWRGPQQQAVWLMDRATVHTTRALARHMPPNWRVVRTADVDGDRRDDVLWQNRATGAVEVWHMDGEALHGVSQLPGAPEWALAP